jgi:hypothetical protein
MSSRGLTAIPPTPMSVNMLLFTPSEPPPNPHHPFVYRDMGIRFTGDLGDRYEADVWESRESGWCWSARSGSYPVDAGATTEDLDLDWTKAPGGSEYGDEEHAVKDAVAWLRERCVALHGSCG